MNFRFNNIKSRIINILKNNYQFFIFGFLIFFTLTVLYSFNLSKKKNENRINVFLNNIYLKKTVDNIFLNVKPKFKIINHKISKSETVGSVLLSYSVNKQDVEKIISILEKDINLKKINEGKEINFTIDQSNNHVIYFKVPLNKSKNIILTKKLLQDNFKKNIVTTNLTKKIIYREDIILESLYKSALNQKIPANTIIEFARIYGFEVDFQRDIRKQDTFQIMYEVFYDDKIKLSKLEIFYFQI